jgi:hypothetical protein
MVGWTLQLLIDCDIAVLARCGRDRCDNHQELDLDRLKAKYGPDSSAMRKDLLARMRCSKCGNDKIGLSYSPRYQRTAGRQVADRYDPLNLLRPAGLC